MKDLKEQLRMIARVVTTVGTWNLPADRFEEVVHSALIEAIECEKASRGDKTLPVAETEEEEEEAPVLREVWEVWEDSGSFWNEVSPREVDSLRKRGFKLRAIRILEESGLR